MTAQSPRRNWWLWLVLSTIVMGILAGKIVYDFAWYINDRRVSFDVQDATLETLVEQIARDLKYPLFIHYRDGVNASDLPPITFRVQDMPLKTALKWCSEISSCNIFCDGRRIVVGRMTPGKTSTKPFTILCYDRLTGWWGDLRR